jgi:hypothetical protein
MKISAEDFASADGRTILASGRELRVFADDRQALAPGRRVSDACANVQPMRATAASPQSTAPTTGDVVGTNGAYRHHAKVALPAANQGSPDLTMQYGRNKSLTRQNGRSGRRSASFDKASGAKHRGGRVPGRVQYTCDFHNFKSQVSNVGS